MPPEAILELQEALAHERYLRKKADAVRLHVGFYRVMAAIDDQDARVVVTHIGRAT